MASAEMKGKAQALAKLARIPQTVQQVAAVSLDVGTDDLVEHLQAACPVDNQAHGEREPGELKASIRKYETQGRSLSYRIIAAARDKAGKLFGRYVEFGHGPAGPKPFWFPTYRAWKKPFRTKLYADTRRALRALWGS